MTTPDSLARGCEWGGLIPPGAKSILFIDIPRVLRPGNARTFPAVKFAPRGLLVFPSLLSPSKKKSSEVVFETGLQGKPLTDVEALKSATQKSCNGSGSAPWEGKGRRSIETMRQNRKLKTKLDEVIMFMATKIDFCFQNQVDNGFEVNRLWFYLSLAIPHNKIAFAVIGFGQP